MNDLERACEFDAERIWASVVEETGIWMAPYSDQVADFGRLIIPRIRDALAAARREGAEAEAERWRGKLAEQCGKTLAAAAEMREQAAHTARSVLGSGSGTGEYIADAIRALPLTPEEPV